jgi:hypothetical protein
MKIYVVGSSKNKFLPLDNIREKFLIDQPHEGDNIDFLNPWYCELTGLYYLWKHVDDDIVGLEHYRTYFWKNNHPINEVQIKEELKKGDIICGGYSYPAPWCKTCCYDELNKHTKTVSQFLKVLSAKDKEFADYFGKFLKGKRVWACNAFIGPKKIFDKWMEFFFDVIIDFEQICPIGPRTNTLRREGYFAEFMFGAWLEYKGYKIVDTSIMKFNKNLTKPEQIMTNVNSRIKCR